MVSKQDSADILIKTSTLYNKIDFFINKIKVDMAAEMTFQKNKRVFAVFSFFCMYSINKVYFYNNYISSDKHFYNNYIPLDLHTFR